MVILTSILIPIVVSYLTYLVIKKFDNREKNKTQSLLGVDLLSYLIEDVKNGNTIINRTFNRTGITSVPKPLPNKSWNGISTISDELLLRIIYVSKHKSSIKSFAKEIRKQCRDYFEVIVDNWNTTILSHDNLLNPLEIKGYLTDSFPKYFTYSENLLNNLEELKSLLEENANKTFPK